MPGGFVSNWRGSHTGRRAVLLACAAACLAGLGGGCAALTNPVALGVPVRHVPPELLAQPRSGEQTIPLSLLRQPSPDAYRLAPGDVLGVVIDRFLGDPNQPLPVNAPTFFQNLPQYQRRYPPALGYPVPVQDDGTIDLPLAGAVRVAGLTLREAREAIRRLYIDKDLIKPEGTERIIVTLVQPRQYAVLVLRQEAINFATGPESVVTAPISKRGVGFELDLPAYENDVLHALARTGGLPGLDAYNEVIIQRDAFHDVHQRGALLGNLGCLPADRNPLPALGLGGEVIRIPLRLPPGQQPSIRLEDVVLRTGDVVFLEARDQEVFYTGGLLPPGFHVLPRDHDLDVVEAIALVRGPLINGAFGGSNLSGVLINPGFGNPSPTELTVLRRTPGGQQVPIFVDLVKALRDPRERILVKAGDVLILQEKPEEAVARWFTQAFFNFNVLWQPFRDRFITPVVDVAAPDRLPSRLGTVTITPGQ
jgi:hypothetical protein